VGIFFRIWIAIAGIWVVLFIFALVMQNYHIVFVFFLSACNNQKTHIGMQRWGWCDIWKGIQGNGYSLDVTVTFNFMSGVILIGQLVLWPVGHSLGGLSLLDILLSLGRLRNNIQCHVLQQMQSIALWRWPLVKSNGQRRFCCRLEYSTDNPCNYAVIVRPLCILLGILFLWTDQAYRS